MIFVAGSIRSSLIMNLSDDPASKRVDARKPLTFGLYGRWREGMLRALTEAQLKRQRLTKQSI